MNSIINGIKKLIKAIIMIVLVFILGCVVIDQFVALSASRYIDNENMTDVDVVLVLGARVTPQKEPSLMLAQRLDAAIQVYNEGHAEKVIVSGDHADFIHQSGVIVGFFTGEDGHQNGGITGYHKIAGDRGVADPLFEEPQVLLCLRSPTAL